MPTLGRLPNAQHDPFVGPGCVLELWQVSTQGADEAGAARGDYNGVRLHSYMHLGFVISPHIIFYGSYLWRFVQIPPRQDVP